MTRDGRSLLTDLGLLVTALGVLATGLLIWFFASLTFFGEPLDRASYVHMAVGFGVAALLLVLLLVPVRALGAATWTASIALTLAALCGVAGLVALLDGTGAPGGEAEPWWWPLQIYLWSPATWVVAFLVAAAPRLATRQDTNR